MSLGNVKLAKKYADLIQMLALAQALVISCFIHFGSDLISRMYTDIESIQVIVSHLLCHFGYINAFLESCTAVVSGILRGIKKSEWGAIGAVGFIIVSTPL
jgi:Na+-driven multidrug efflux pump